MLEIINISYKLKDKILLDGVSAKFEMGKVSGIIGSNGAGKSTLLKIISGENKLSGGMISFNGKTIENYSHSFPANMRAVVNQHEAIFSDMSVTEYVLLGRLIYAAGYYGIGDYKSVERSLEITNSTILAHKSLLSLSGGERQRVQLSRALAQLDQGNGKYAGYLFLDEFSANMDIYYQQQMILLLKELCVTYNLAIIVIGHDLNQVINYFDYCILLKKGKLFRSGKPKEILDAKSIKSAYGISVKQVRHGISNYFLF